MELNYEDIIDDYAKKHSRRMCFLVHDPLYSKQAAGLVHHHAVSSVPNMSSTLDFTCVLLEVVWIFNDNVSQSSSLNVWIYV